MPPHSSRLEHGQERNVRRHGAPQLWRRVRRAKQEPRYEPEQAAQPHPEEHDPPIVFGDEPSRERSRECRTILRAGEKNPGRCSTPLLFEVFSQEAHGGRSDDRFTQPQQHPARDERSERRCESARGAGQAPSKKPEGQRPLYAVAVDEVPGGNLQDSVGPEERRVEHATIGVAHMEEGDQALAGDGERDVGAVDVSDRQGDA